MGRVLVAGLALAGNLCGAYTYYLTQNNGFSTGWTQNGTPANNRSGVVFGAYGSLSSTVAVPDASADYEVRTSNYTWETNLAFVQYLRASSDALHSESVSQGSY